MFYIGKGARTRPADHVRKAFEIRAENYEIESRELQLIRDLLNDDLPVSVIDINVNVANHNALRFEFCMIQALGLSNLHNVDPSQIGILSKKDLELWSMETVHGIGAELLMRYVNRFVL